MTVPSKDSLGAKKLLNKNETYKTNQYLGALTALRGIAALWVVLFHMDVIIFYRELGSILPHDWSGLISQGYLWVDFFFILSGFIICHIYGEQFSGNFQTSHIIKYLLARFFRIYPLHLFTIMILVGFVIVISNFIPIAIDDSWNLYFDWQALLSNIFLTNAMNQHTYLSWNIVSWSIGAEWWAYIFGIGLLYYVANNKKHSVIIAAVSFFCLTCLVYFHQKNNLDITFDFGFLRCFFEFSLGVTSYQVFKLNLAKNIFQQDKTFIITLLALLAIFHLRLNDLLAIPLFFTLVLCAAFNRQVILCLLSKPIPQYLGRISYSIYLMHGVWFMVFWFVLPILKDAWLIKSLSITQTGFYIVTFMTLTLISAIYSHRYIELPFRYLPIQKNIKLLLTADK